MYFRFDYAQTLNSNFKTYLKYYGTSFDSLKMFFDFIVPMYEEKSEREIMTGVEGRETLLEQSFDMWDLILRYYNERFDDLYDRYKDTRMMKVTQKYNDLLRLHGHPEYCIDLPRGNEIKPFC